MLQDSFQKTIMNDSIRNLASSGLLGEVRFRASCSSGPGGQAVNKVNSRVELLFKIDSSLILTTDEKARVKIRLANKINSDGELYVSSQAHRSQLMNKQECINRLILLLTEALKVGKQRVKTSAPINSKLKRLELKRHRSERKKQRQKPGLF